MTKVMFWNLYEAAPKLRAGDARMWDAQVDVIRQWAPDILAVTECWEWDLDSAALFHRARRDYRLADGHLYRAKTGCHMAIMWAEGFEVGDIMELPWERAFWHGFVRGRVHPREGNDFTLMLSHLNPFDPTLRRTEGSQLRAQLQRLDRGVLVMDANTVPPGDEEPAATPSRNLPGTGVADRAPLQGLADVGLVDVGAAAGNRQATHGHFDQGPRIPLIPVRMDQAWATPDLAITGYRVGDTTSDAASDHRPIGFTVV